MDKKINSSNIRIMTENGERDAISLWVGNNYGNSKCFYVEDGNLLEFIEKKGDENNGK